MEGYTDRSYGDGFADVYDEWYQGISDVDATVRFLHALAGDGGRVLELAVGTGRLAIPLAATGTSVVGVDASQAMLDVLRPEQRAAYDAERERRRTEAAKDMEAVGLTLPANWEMLDEDGFR